MKRLGLGIAYAIIVGLGAVLGTLVPLWFQQKASVREQALELIVSGVVVMSIGIFLTTWSGQIKERAAAAARNLSHRSYLAAVLLACAFAFQAQNAGTVRNRTLRVGGAVVAAGTLAGDAIQPGHVDPAGTLA